MSEEQPVQTRWERRTEIPLAVLAVLFLLGYAWPILEPGLGTGWRLVCSVLVWGSWAVFVVDLVVRVRQAPSRADWARHHVLDVAVLALPMLRPLRALLVVSVLRVLNRVTAKIGRASCSERLSFIL